MKWVSLFKAESSVHSLPFFSRWTLQFHKARKKKEEGEGGGGSKRARTAVKEETQGKQRLAEPESPPSLGYDWFFPCARMTKKIKTKEIQNGALKTKMREEEEDFLLGCCVGCCIFLFHKATLGFDAVVVVRGLAAATGFRLWALLDVRLRHTPPGGEVEGHTPCPRESPIPLPAVPLQLVKRCGQLRVWTIPCSSIITVNSGENLSKI